jgi:hypothetical protein
LSEANVGTAARPRLSKRPHECLNTAEERPFWAAQAPHFGLALHSCDQLSADSGVYFRLRSRAVKTDAAGGRNEGRGPSTPQNDSLRESFCYAQDDNLEVTVSPENELALF